MKKNVERKEDLKQVCIWPGVVLGNNTPEDFEEFMQEQFGVRVQYLETILTKPDTDSSGREVPDTGGRSDLFFAIHSNDIMKFSIARLQAGIRWIEDVLSKDNYMSRIYPERVFDYCTWNEQSLAAA